MKGQVIQFIRLLVPCLDVSEDCRCHCNEEGAGFKEISRSRASVTGGWVIRDRRGQVRENLS